MACFSFFLELPYFPTLWQRMHSKLPRRLLNEAHASMLCFFFLPPPSHAVCAPDVDVVGVLDQDETFGGISSTSWRTSTALNHPPLASLPSLPMGGFFFYYGLNTFLTSGKDVEGGRMIVILNKTEKQLLQSGVRCFQDGQAATGQGCRVHSCHRCWCERPGA